MGEGADAAVLEDMGRRLKGIKKQKQTKTK